MMGSDTASDNRVPMTMPADLRMLLNPGAHEVAPGLVTFDVPISTH
jgi:hypothetical protein